MPKSIDSKEVRRRLLDTSKAALGLDNHYSRPLEPAFDRILTRTVGSLATSSSLSSPVQQIQLTSKQNPYPYLN